jgi:hypothetical protein
MAADVDLDELPDRDFGVDRRRLQFLVPEQLLVSGWSADHRKQRGYTV